MRRAFLAAILAASIALLGLLFLYYSGENPYVEKGTCPKFNAVLVDNGGNDYIVFKFLHPGTLFYKMGVPLQVGETLIYVSWDNRYFPELVFDNLLPNEGEWGDNLFKFRPPPVNLFPSENVKITFNADVVQVGKKYNVFWMARVDNRGLPVINFGKTRGQWWVDLVVVENI